MSTKEILSNGDIPPVEATLGKKEVLPSPSLAMSERHHFYKLYIFGSRESDGPTLPLSFSEGSFF